MHITLTYSPLFWKLLQLHVPLYLLFVCASGSNSLTTQGDCVLEYDALSNQKVYVYVDKMPEYNGGDKALLDFFAEHFKYPKQEQFQATFLVEFIIDEEGKLFAPRIKNKIKSDLSDAEIEVLKVLENTPKWIAGSCNDKNVPVRMFLPLNL